MLTSRVPNVTNPPRPLRKVFGSAGVATLILLLATGSGCQGSARPRRAVGSTTLDEYFFHLRNCQGAESFSTWSHLRRASTLSQSFQLYAETGSSEDGLGVALKTLFGDFLGPYSFEELRETGSHLAQ